MIDTQLWKKNVLEAIKDISDKSYQEKAWFGIGDEVSSLEEMYCALYDSLLFEDFLTSRETGLNSKQMELGEILLKKLDKFSDAFPEEYVDPKVVLNHPLWIEVRKAAKEFLDSFSENTNKSKMQFDRGKRKLVLFIDTVLQLKVWTDPNSPVLNHPCINNYSKDRGLFLSMSKHKDYDLLMETLYAYEDALDDDWISDEIANLNIQQAKLFLMEIRDIILNIEDTNIEKELIMRHERITTALNDKEIK